MSYRNDDPFDPFVILTGVMPLSEFPPQERARIEYLASLPTPPPKWLNGGLSQIASRAYYEWRLRHDEEFREKRRERKRVKRIAIADRDGWLCGICGDPIDPADLQIDHIFPICLGGNSNAENLQAAHAICNQRKGGRAL